MADTPISWAVALDGGTTNTRARSIVIDSGRIIATARRSVGVRDVVFSGGMRPLDIAVWEVVEDVCRKKGGRPSFIVASGMLSSEVGLVTVPHVLAPAGVAELARGAVLRSLPTIADEPILFVPGVRTPPATGPDGWSTADVMRGEECETLGAWIQLQQGNARTQGAAAFVWPGSHTKLVEVDASGRIVRSQTTLAGEMTQAMARHTLLAASLPEDLPEVPDAEAVAAGCRLVEREGLGRSAFLVRVAALTGTLGPDERAAFWIGCVVGDDVAHLARNRIISGRPDLPVWVGGRQPLRDLYTRLLAGRHSGPVASLDDETAESASPTGGLAVARCRQ